MADVRWLLVSNHNKLWLCILIICSINRNNGVFTNPHRLKNNLAFVDVYKKAAPSRVQYPNIRQVRGQELSNAQLSKSALARRQQSKTDVNVRTFQRYQDFYVGSVDHSVNDDDARQTYNSILSQQSEIQKEKEEKVGILHTQFNCLMTPNIFEIIFSL